VTKADDFACACATARLAARTLTQLYDAALRDSGLEATQFALLMTLDKLGPCRQSALGERQGLDKTTVSRNLRWLERRGWIKIAAGEDRRSRLVTLTAAGRRTLAAATPKWRRAQEDLRAEMTGTEWGAMFAAMRGAAEAAARVKRRRR
jgi:DNA-binding MarR family transcriptional regulator